MTRLHIIYELTDPRRLADIEASADALLKDVLAAKGGGNLPDLREAIWPALCLPENAGRDIPSTQLTLVSLDRIGQMEGGKSGSLVLIGWFEDPASELPPSQPLVVKSLPAPASSDDRDKLREEFDNAIRVRPCAGHSLGRFAFPFRFDESRPSYRVLWSLFHSSRPYWVPGSAREGLALEDLRQLLRDDRNDEAERLLDEAYGLLKGLHGRLRTGACKRTTYGAEYKTHLRAFGLEWGEKWQGVFGSERNMYCDDGGRRYVNPLWLIRRLMNESADLTMGAVHGDFHAGNVVAGEDGGARIIDFGWASDRGHVAKDFALMECNLRFMFLWPEINEADSGTFAEWVAWDAAPPPAENPHVAGRIKLVGKLRDLLRQTIPDPADWDREYLIPLFLVAFGLLRYGRQIENQRSAVRTVLALGEHVAAALRLGASADAS